MPALTPVKRMALRGLAEGEAPTLERLADASGRSLRTLRIEARRDGWRLARDGLEELRARMQAMLEPAVEIAQRLAKKLAEDDGTIARADVEAAMALMRLIQQVTELTRPQEAAANGSNKHDEDLASVLEFIDGRIYQMARELADWMVAGSRGQRSCDGGA